MGKHLENIVQNIKYEKGYINKTYLRYRKTY